MEGTQAELRTLRNAVQRLEERLGRWTNEPHDRLKDEPDYHTALVADLLIRPWPGCTGLSTGDTRRSSVCEGSQGDCTSSCSRLFGNDSCHAGSSASLPAPSETQPQAPEVPLFCGLEAAPKFQAAAGASQEEEAETDCSSGGGDHWALQLVGNIEERSLPEPLGSASARRPEIWDAEELTAQPDKASRPAVLFRSDLATEVQELKDALAAKDAALQAAESARLDLVTEARAESDARQQLSLKLRSEQLALSRCHEELAQSRAAHQQEWLLGKQLSQDLKAARATAEALRADLRDAGERVAEQHAKTCEMRTALEKERRDAQRVKQSLDECRKELQLCRTPVPPSPLPKAPTNSLESSGDAPGPGHCREVAITEPFGESRAQLPPAVSAASPKVSAIARLLGQGGSDQDLSDGDVSQKVSFLEDQLRRYCTERDSLETALRKLPSNSTGKSVAERRRIGEMQQRLADVERTMVEMKTGLRRLRQADG